ncbi:MAG: hypothetical protein NTY91_07225, partial [Euryarchaeota archaeon]|nr:hypothetical protein [Euryarchaeota archaeon]
RTCARSARVGIGVRLTGDCCLIALHIGAWFRWYNSLLYVVLCNSMTMVGGNRVFFFCKVEK